MRTSHRLLFATLILTAWSCRSKTPRDTLFTEVTNSGIEFTNTLEETKEFNVFKYRNFYNGGGVATGDLNNDGLPEVFFTANQGSNKLFLNKGNIQFEDISEKAGFGAKEQWTTGVVFVDLNQDGWLDIYLCNAGHMLDSNKRHNQLFLNNHDLTFTEKAAEYGLDDDGYTTQASFFDYDLDGDLDCFLVNNSPLPVNTLNYANTRQVPAEQAPVADFLKGGGDHLYRNDNGKFVDVSKQAGIYGSIISFGLGVTVGDVNQDGWPDVYVSNDFFEKDYLYINQRNGTFRDELEQRIQHISLSSMGADIGDINNDGHPDIFTTDMLPDDDYRLKTNTSFEGYDVFTLKQNQGFYNQYTQNSLQVNNGGGQFYETGFFSGVAASDWSWGALFFDADNDGRSDILVCNGIYRDVTDQDFIDFFANDVVMQMVTTGKKEEVNNVIDQMPSVPVPNKLFRNAGGLRFEDKGNDWGLDKATFSNGAAYADLDNDGDLDLLINNVNQPALLYKNNTREKSFNHYIALQLQYKQPNLFAVGSEIRLYQGDQVLTRAVLPSRGFQSSVEYKQTIGLGQSKIDSIQISWPDRTITTLTNIPIDQLHVINHAKSTVHVNQSSTQSLQQPLFDSVGLNFATHLEDEYIDYYTERNIPFLLSRIGPKSATADVNGDGKKDIYIGGSKAQAGKLYLQTATGFSEKQDLVLQSYAFNDANVVRFFDADQDGDADLFVGGGGNFESATSNIYQHLLFLNDGKANFTLQAGSFPLTGTNAGVAVPMDYDNDGDLDLFSGSRSQPQNYGIAPNSFIFQNDGKAHFTNVTAQVAPFLNAYGMVTDANWSDLNGDGRAELTITGEWMATKTYSFTNGKFTTVENGLESYKGWWQTMQAVDLDKDGDLDLIIGNLGENFYLRPQTDRPVRLWVKDIDENGLSDKILTQTIQGKDMPVLTKREITDQVPSLKKENLKHHEFAKKTVQDLFGKDLSGASMIEVNRASSIIAWNDGKGKFTVQDLPLEAQLSSIAGIVAEDINGDGYLDLLTAGNYFDLLPQFCRVDAGFGLVMINDGKKNFRALNAKQSGIYLQGAVRQIQPVHMGNETMYLFLQNQDRPRAWKRKRP